MNDTPQDANLAALQGILDTLGHVRGALNELRIHVFTLRKIVIARGLVTEAEYSDLYLQFSVAVETPQRQISDLNRLLDLDSNEPYQGPPKAPEE